VFQPFCINLRTGRLAHYQVILRSGVEELALDIPIIILLELKVEEENAKPLLSIPHSAGINSDVGKLV
jgi:hypothetical protein